MHTYQEDRDLYIERKRRKGAKPQPEESELTHLYKAHADSAHFSELIDGLEAVVHRLCQ